MKNAAFEFNILLADDDNDDRLFFQDALAELPLKTLLTTVNDGELLMRHLENISPALPDVLFLDLNMPRKNGFECLIELKKHNALNLMPVIIYSTSYDEDKAKELFENGAHYYICKPADFTDLKKVIHHALHLIRIKNFQPTKESFLITNLNNVY